MSLQQRELTADDGHCIHTFEWPTDIDQPVAVVQILHGLGDHAMRYARFAAACNGSGLQVVAHNHRGHGVEEGFGHFADKDGWDRIIADALQVRQDIGVRYPELPAVLFGHSMGSFIAQSVVMRHPGHFAALVLSGSTLADRLSLRISHAAALLAAATGGRQRMSDFLNHMGLGKMNDPFKPGRTESDWISRDNDEVDRYVADPFCGGRFSNQLWCDLSGGLLEITSPAAIRSVSPDLPMLIMGGECDPVGGKAGLNRLADAYRGTGHQNLKLKIYPGGRHEMLNETNREAVTVDIIRWILMTLSNLAPKPSRAL